MKNINRIITIIMLITLINIPVFAEEIIDSGKLDHVMLELGDGTVVNVDINDYSNAYLDGEGHRLFDFLKGENLSPKIRGVVSGYKYIDINNFSNSYLDNDGDLRAILNGFDIEKLIDVGIISNTKNLVFDDGKIGYEPILEEIKLINAIPTIEGLTLEDEENIIKARDAYNALSDYIKGFIRTEVLDHLIAAEEQIELLRGPKIYTLGEIQANAVKSAGLLGVYLIDINSSNIYAKYPEATHKSIFLINIDDIEYELRYYPSKDTWRTTKAIQAQVGESSEVTAKLNKLQVIEKELPKVYTLGEIQANAVKSAGTPGTYMIDINRANIVAKYPDATNDTVFLITIDGVEYEIEHYPRKDTWRSKVAIQTQPLDLTETTAKLNALEVIVKE